MSMVTETRWVPDLMVEREAFLWTTMKGTSEVATVTEINVRKIRADAEAEESFLITISIFSDAHSLVRGQTYMYIFVFLFTVLLKSLKYFKMIRAFYNH